MYQVIICTYTMINKNSLVVIVAALAIGLAIGEE